MSVVYGIAGAVAAVKLLLLVRYLRGRGPTDAAEDVLRNHSGF